jgi:cystathionine beta-lyase
MAHHQTGIENQEKRNTMAQATFDTISVDHLRNVVGRKWSTFPDCTGAFIAEMDFGTAPSVQAALRQIVDDGFFGYLSDNLVDQLRASTAGWYAREYGWEIPTKWIHPLPDVLAGLEVTIKHYAAPGAKVIVATPAYMPFLMVKKIWGSDEIQVPMLNTGERWEFDFEALERTYAANPGSIFIVCNPFNPVGRVLDLDELLRISEIVDRYGGRVFSDEIHAPIRYGKTHIPYASISETAANHTITTVSASKAWNLPGLKCAELILSNDADLETWNTEAGFISHGTSSFGVVANIAAFDTGAGWLNEVLDYLDGNRYLLRDLLATHLPEVGYNVPEGTYLALLDFSAYDLPEDLAAHFRENAKVAVTNGADCGEISKRSIRFNFAMSRPVLEQAIAQLATAV